MGTGARLSFGAHASGPSPLGPRSVRKVIRISEASRPRLHRPVSCSAPFGHTVSLRGRSNVPIYKQRTVVKSWMMRGTLHWVDAADYPVWAAASRTRAPWNKKYWQKYFGVTGKQVEAAVDAIADALDGTVSDSRTSSR